jgi:hypothetical protein
MKLSDRLQELNAKGEYPGVDEIANAKKLEEMLEWAVYQFDPEREQGPSRATILDIAEFRPLPLKTSNPGMDQAASLLPMGS